MDGAISTVTIAGSALAAIVGHAAVAWPVEACGLLMGRGDGVETAIAAANVAADPTTAFEIDPAALIAAHRAARSGAPPIVGWYHSHPNGVAAPSPTDAARAAPDGRLWLIAAGGQVAAWRSCAAGIVHGRFVPVELVAA